MRVGACALVERLPKGRGALQISSRYQYTSIEENTSREHRGQSVSVLGILEEQAAQDAQLATAAALGCTACELRPMIADTENIP